jgi:hypothetical protein
MPLLLVVDFRLDIKYVRLSYSTTFDNGLKEAYSRVLLSSNDQPHCVAPQRGDTSSGGAC